jgi:hypothetical protein
MLLHCELITTFCPTVKFRAVAQENLQMGSIRKFVLVIGDRNVGVPSLLKSPCLAGRHSDILPTRGVNY